LLGFSAAQLVVPVPSTGQSPLGILLEQANADIEVAIVLQAFLGDAATRAREPALDIAGDVSAAVAHFLAARRLLLDTLARISDDDLHRAGNGPTPAEMVERRYVDCARRVAELGRRWPEPSAPRLGPPCLLLAALRAARKELLTTIALIPDDERPRYSLPDDSSLQSHLSGLASHDRDLLGETPIGPEAGDTVSPADQWRTIWRDLHATRHRLLTLLEASVDEDLRAPMGLYEDICRLVETDRALATRLRESLRTTHLSVPSSFTP
jgi:hypothetical protein